MGEDKAEPTSDRERRRLAAGGEPAEPTSAVGPNSVVGPSGTVGGAAIKPNVLAKLNVEPPVTESKERDWFDDDDIDVIDRILEGIDRLLDRLTRRFR
jgi:hypothetical protein